MINSKFTPSKSALMNNDALTQIIMKKSNKRANRIIEIKLEESSPLTYDTDIFTYGKFTVSETGYYNVSNQCCVRCEKSLDIKCIQYGICDKDLEEFGKCIDSKVMNTTIPKGSILSNNLSTFKYLEEGVEYIVWLNIVSSDNTNLTWLNDYSNLLLLKI